MSSAADSRKWQARFAFFVERGLLERVPTWTQVVRATLPMLPFIANETPVEHAANRKHMLGHIPLRIPLQLAYCPQQLVVWNGLRQRPQTLVRHLLSAFHEDGVIAYDLQLIQSHGALDALAGAADDVAHRRKPLSSLLAAIAGDYHAHLAELARRAMKFEYPDGIHPHYSSFVAFGRHALTL